MTKKRYRKPKVKPGELIVYYGKTRDGAGPDVCYSWGGGGSHRCDSLLLHSMFSGYGHTVEDDKSVWQSHRSVGYLRELEKRGYDLETLRFYIKQKEVNP